MAYGTKIISRENFARRVERLSSTSAAASETSIWIGIRTSEKRSTKNTPLRTRGR